jgi:exodeoxyribonuclease VII small subunit
VAEESSSTSEFEASLAELERIVARLDREELSLDEALELFESGVSHLRTASRLLDDARGVVEELIEDASGELATVDFDLPVADGGDGGD